MIGIKEFNKKITSLTNTGKMTKTMKMVSASKFKRAYKFQAASLDYACQLQVLLSHLSLTDDQQNHPLVEPRHLPSKALFVLFTSDKGLCGGFNNNLIRTLRTWLGESPYKYHQVSFSFCGRRGYIAFRKSQNVQKFYANITDKPNFADALMVAKDLTDSYVNREFDEIYLAYNHFKGPLSQTPVIEKFLPLDPAVLTNGGAGLPVLDRPKDGPGNPPPPKADYEYEPEQNELIGFLISKFLNFKIYFALLENAAGEHGARMAAMDKASQNTNDLIDHYILLRNRARQAAITTELTEIISGAEALK